MIGKINKYTPFFFSFLLALLIYSPSLEGAPIWDDYLHWFYHPDMQTAGGYREIWIHYAWPLSVSIQKFLFSIFETNYLYYHVLNVILHFINSLLVYRLGKILKLNYPFFLFLLFLVHPVAVMATAWMIQLKTLLCFFFALLSLITFIKALEDKKWFVPSLIFFTFSVLSKSSSLPLGIIFLILGIRNYKQKNLLRLFPLLISIFLILGIGALKILKSPVTIEGAQKAALHLKENNLAISLSESSSSTSSFFKFHPALIAHSFRHYFWQSFLPLENPTVRGIITEGSVLMDVIHLIFLLTLLFIFKKSFPTFLLISGHILLSPYLGFLPAPFMTITWVSDQHLYFSLPVFLAFWLILWEKFNWKHKTLIPLIFAVFFSLNSFQAAKQYSDQFTFYEKALEYNPTNIPIAYNLALARISEGNIPLAWSVLNETHHLVSIEPELKKNLYFPLLEKLYFKIKKGLESK